MQTMCEIYIKSAAFWTKLKVLKLNSDRKMQKQILEKIRKKRWNAVKMQQNIGSNISQNAALMQ